MIKIRIRVGVTLKIRVYQLNIVAGANSVHAYVDVIERIVLIVLKFLNVSKISHINSFTKGKMADVSTSWKPDVTIITDSTIDLQWTKPTIGDSNISSYLVKYSEKMDKTEEWIICMPCR